MATSSLLWPPPSSSLVTVVARTIITNTSFLTANANRRGALIYNDIESGILLVKLGSGCSSTDFTTSLLPRSLFELPDPAYTGIITGVWLTGGAGQARITELVV